MKTHLSQPEFRRRFAESAPKRWTEKERVVPEPALSAGLVAARRRTRAPATIRWIDPFRESAAR